MWLNQRTVDAIRIMAALAEAAPAIVKAGRLAEITAITPLNVQKTANILAQVGLVEAARGPYGGMRLARPAQSISVGEIARAFEPKDCPANFLAASEVDARISKLIFSAHRAFFRSLEATALADLGAAGVLDAMAEPPLLTSSG